MPSQSDTDTTNALRWAEKYLSNLQAGDHAPSAEVMAVLWAGLEALASAREPVDPLVEEGLAYFEKSGDAGDKMYVAAIRRALTQPRDTPRDSGDAVLRAANKLAAAAMTTGGVAGADPHLQEAIDAFIAARDAAMQSLTGEPT